MKDVNIKNLLENKHKKKYMSLKIRFLTLQSEHNSLEQYGRCNNNEITGIPDSVTNQNLEEKLWIF